MTMEQQFDSFWQGLESEEVREIAAMRDHTNYVRPSWQTFAYWYSAHIGSQNAETVQAICAWAKKRRCMTRFKEAVFNGRDPLMIWEEYILKDKAI